MGAIMNISTQVDAELWVSPVSSVLQVPNYCTMVMQDFALFQRPVCLRIWRTMLHSLKIEVKKRKSNVMGSHHGNSFLNNDGSGRNCLSTFLLRIFLKPFRMLLKLF